MAKSVLHVPFGGGICGRGVVDIQLQFPETENLRILLLTEVIIQVRRRNILGIFHLDMCLVEQVFPLRHELGRTARRKQQTAQHCQYAPDSM